MSVECFNCKELIIYLISLFFPPHISIRSFNTSLKSFLFPLAYIYHCIL